MEVYTDPDGNQWLVVDSLQNAIDNLEMLNHFLGMKRTSKWKWAAIAAHQALYGLLLSALSGTSGEYSVLDLRKDGSKAIRLHIEGVPAEKIAAAFGVDDKTLGKWLVNPQVISIHEALKRMEDTSVRRSLDFKHLKRTKEQQESTDHLINGVRNEFEHFVPRSMAFDMADFAPMLRHVVEVIRFVALESNGVFADTKAQSRIVRALDSIEQRLRPTETVSPASQQV